jgi:hypothetical protein
MKENIKKNKNMIIKPAPPIVECKRMQELKEKMNKICEEIKQRYM